MGEEGVIGKIETTSLYAYATDATASLASVIAFFTFSATPLSWIFYRETQCEKEMGSRLSNLEDMLEFFERGGDIGEIWTQVRN